MFTNKLSVKFTLPFACIIVLFASFLTYEYIQDATRGILIEKTSFANALARNLAYNAEFAVLTKNYPMLDTLIAGVMHENNVIKTTILDNSGKILYSSGETKYPSIMVEQPIISQTTKLKKNKDSETLLLSDGQQEEIKKERIGKVRLVLSLDEMYNEMAFVRKQIIYYTVVSLILAVGMSLFLVKKITSPLKTLVSATEKIAMGALEHRVRLTSRDEIGLLADSFNKMTEHLSTTLVTKEYVNNIIQSMVDMLLVLDNSFTIKTANHSAANILGYAESELTGTSVKILFADPQSPSLIEWLQKLFSGSAATNIREDSFRAKNGAIIPSTLR